MKFLDNSKTNWQHLFLLTLRAFLLVSGILILNCLCYKRKGDSLITTIPFVQKGARDNDYRDYNDAARKDFTPPSGCSEMDFELALAVSKDLAFSYVSPKRGLNSLEIDCELANLDSGGEMEFLVTPISFDGLELRDEYNNGPLFVYQRENNAWRRILATEGDRLSVGNCGQNSYCAVTSIFMGDYTQYTTFGWDEIKSMYIWFPEA